MKARMLALALCLCALPLGLFACAPSDTPASPTQESTASPTAPVTDAPTEEPTEAPTAPATDAPTEPETAPVNEEELALMNAMLSESYEGHPLPIGGWSTPATGLREVYSGEAGSYDRAFALLADAGLNFMITQEEWSSGSWPVESLTSAKRAGMKLWYNCVAMETDYSMEKINALLASDAADALGAIYVKDEPTVDQIPDTAEKMQGIRDALGETSTLPILSNLLPTYASTDMVTKDYRGYVRTYLDAAKPDRLMLDYYPYGTSGDTLPAMIGNLAVAREEADKDGIELYTFLQSSGWPGMREPNPPELRANAHLNFALGVKGVAYFLACEQYESWEYSAMLDVKGNTTPLYKKIKDVNAELAGFKGVFLGFDHKGILLANYDAVATLLEKKYDSSAVLSSFGSLTSYATDSDRKALIGCFEDKDGHEGYYVVNPNYKQPVDVTLTFNEAQHFVIWTKDGPEHIESTDRLTLKLTKGDAAFVVKFDVNE